MRASRLVYIIVGALITLALAVYMPIQIIEKVSAKQLDPIFGGIVLLVFILTGGATGFFTVVLPVLEGMGLEEVSEEKRAEVEYLEEKLKVYRARQRAMLEELDEIRDTLREIRDILRRGMEG